MTNNVVSISEVSKNYKAFKLDNISFDIPKGYITGFIGPNGSGKTTTIKILLSLIKSEGGDVVIFNERLQNLTHLKRIGVILDNPFFSKDWTISDVEKAVSPFYDHWNSSMFQDYLTRFKIDKDLKVSELSRGMSIKLSFAVALSHQPDFLILDEPTSGLDPVAREEICEILQDFVSDENKSVLFSTHITSDLESVADYIVFILNGKIIYTGSKDDLLESYVLIKGGLEELNQINQKDFIGIKKSQMGFEAAIQKNQIRNESAFLIEPITLEQLIIFFNRGENNNE